MLISSDLPLDRDKFTQNDRVLTITEANWQDYQNFNSQECSGYLNCNYAIAFKF